MPLTLDPDEFAALFVCVFYLKCMVYLPVLPDYALDKQKKTLLLRNHLRDSARVICNADLSSR